MSLNSISSSWVVVKVREGTEELSKQDELALKEIESFFRLL
jgi:hypothetical protein